MGIFYLDFESLAMPLFDDYYKASVIAEFERMYPLPYYPLDKFFWKRSSKQFLLNVLVPKTFRFNPAGS